MKNVKLTIATTLSVLALTFATTVSADGGGNRDKRFNNHKQKNVITKPKTANTKFTKNINRHVVRNSNNKRTLKKVMVKRTPTNRVVFTRTIVEKPAKTRFVASNRFKQTKRYQPRVKNNRYVKYNNRNIRFIAKRVTKRTVYSVRPGDTLIQISFKTGVSIHQLARLNRIKHGNLNRLRIGQILRLV